MNCFVPMCNVFLSNRGQQRANRLTGTGLTLHRLFCLQEYDQRRLRLLLMVLLSPTGFFEMKMKYDESDNALVRASRAVTDRVTDFLGNVPSYFV